MRRRQFLEAGLAGATAVGIARARVAAGQRDRSGDLDENREYSIRELQELMVRGRTTSAAITQHYLARIDAIDGSGPAINSVIETNPDALRLAEAFDRERAAGKVRGPLHGVPVLIKDNIDTADRMKTSAGSLVLGKTNLSEWANFRSSRSTSGWSGRGGLTRNPYVLDRNPCGSSSGSGAAVAANLCAAAVGTETDGSIVCPATANGIVGLKPTLGLISRAGIIPIAASQDTAGPMTRSVADAALLLAAMTGVDARDALTTRSRGRTADYASFLDAGGLKGTRLGIMRNYFGFHDGVDALMTTALEALKSAGAVLVDPANLPTKRQLDDPELEVLLYEFKDGLNKYLTALPDTIRTRTLKALIEFNEANRNREMPWFGQDLFLKAQEKGPLTSPAYLKARRTCVQLSRTLGIDAVMTRHRLDALVAPTGGAAWVTDFVNGDHFTGGSSTPAAVAGYPSITVPAGLVSGLPVGISFIGWPWTEGLLIKIAHGFEQTTKLRQPPKFLPTLATGT
jgi:amidase